MHTNANLDLVNINAYAKLCPIPLINSLDTELKRKLDLVIIKVYEKLCWTLSFHSKGNEKLAGIFFWLSHMVAGLGVVFYYIDSWSFTSSLLWVQGHESITNCRRLMPKNPDLGSVKNTPSQLKMVGHKKNLTLTIRVCKATYHVEAK